MIIDIFIPYIPLSGLVTYNGSERREYRNQIKQYDPNEDVNGKRYLGSIITLEEIKAAVE